jgi:hypothetical protein
MSAGLDELLFSPEVPCCIFALSGTGSSGVVGLCCSAALRWVHSESAMAAIVEWRRMSGWMLET